MFKKLLVLFLLLVCASAEAAAPTRPNSYTSGTTIRSADVTANEVALYNYLQAGVDTYSDGSIVNADIANAAGIPYSKLSLGNSIFNSDINTAAAIAYSKLNLTGAIRNVDISATAAIVDTKLAQITTASKVSGAALTSLSSIPSGAGIVPVANLGSGTPSSLTFLRGDGAWIASGAGNVLFQYAGQIETQGASEGEYAGSSLNPNGGTGNYRFLQTTNSSYTTVYRTKWEKIASVSTVTVWCQIWVRAVSGSNPKSTANFKLNIGSANGEVTGTGDQTTPEWKSFTIDVSGLTNGTTYDVTGQLKDSGLLNDDVYLGNMIAFAS